MHSSNKTFTRELRRCFSGTYDAAVAHRNSLQRRNHEKYTKKTRLE
ncbi:MAG: hypothetical protein QS721_05975 [Candidatus Endonucleobacter sp. (ex Gigantidas childressi)]|nr:hypothetical protein [Candidatus Endonucleobacter sp. (ex Gigantidas childressi)]